MHSTFRFFILVIFLLVVVQPNHSIAQTFGLKYNAIGHLLDNYAEYGMEGEYVNSKRLGAFLRFAYIDRDYDDEDWSGNVVSNTKEKGQQYWIGGKYYPFQRIWFRNCVFSLFYRYSQLKLDHVSLAHTGWAAGTTGNYQTQTHAIGVGISFKIIFSQHLIVEPFWYGDYGYYKTKSIINSVESLNEPYHPWDDEHRVGLNIGVQL